MKSLTEICKEADEYRNDMTKLKHLWEYVKSNRNEFTDSEYGFIAEHIRNHVQAFKEREDAEQLKKKFQDDD